MIAHPTVLIGVGNRDRGDDAVGPVVCDLVDDRTSGAIATVVLESSVLDLSHHWGSDDRVVVVDAGRPGTHPGRIIEYDGLDTRLVVPTSVSTHSIDVGGAIELARVLDRLPTTLVVIAIEGESFEFGALLSAAVRESAAEIAGRLSRHGAIAPGGV